MSSTFYKQIQLYQPHMFMQFLWFIYFFCLFHYIFYYIFILLYNPFFHIDFKKSVVIQRSYIIWIDDPARPIHQSVDSRC